MPSIVWMFFKKLLKRYLSHVFISHGQTLGTGLWVCSHLNAGQWERRTTVEGTEQKALFSWRFRFCWLRRRTILGDHGQVTTEKGVTIGNRTQSEPSAAWGSESQDERAAKPVGPRSPTVGGRGRPLPFDYKATLAGGALIAPRWKNIGIYKCFQRTKLIPS